MIPDGRTLEWMKGMEHRLSSVAVIFETVEGEALIVKAGYKPYWTFPGGVVDKGETPRQTAVREVREELGLTIAANALAFVAVIDRMSEDTQTYQFVFRYTSVLTKEMQASIVLEKAEITDYALVSKSHVETNDRPYGKIIYHWVNGASGYLEQAFTVLG